MASVACYCRECGVKEADSKLPLCKACGLVAYCSRDCQKANWKQHKPCCNAVATHVKMISLGQGRMGSAELRRLGTTSGTTRENERAEKLAKEARVHKKACRFDQAIFLYNQALKLDPYNHMYYHHRGETWMIAVQHFKRMTVQHHLYLDLAVLDAQRALDLCPSEDVPWLTMIRASLEMGHLDNAQRFIDMALQVVPDDAWARPLLLNYKSKFEEMKMMPGSPGIVLLSDPNQHDKYFYAHTNGMHNHARTPELIAVDLDMARITSFEGVLRWIGQEALAGSISLAFGSVFQVPNGGPWVTPIPVSVTDDPEATREGILPLMGSVQAASNIVVLKIDYRDGEPDPLSKAQALRYLQAMADNALQVESLYGNGIKLVPDI